MGARRLIIMVLAGLGLCVRDLLVMLACGAGVWYGSTEIVMPVTRGAVNLQLGWTGVAADQQPAFPYPISYALTLHLAAAVGSFATTALFRPVSRWRIVLPSLPLFVVWSNAGGVVQALRHQSLAAGPSTGGYSGIDVAAASFILLPLASALAIPTAVGAAWCGFLWRQSLVGHKQVNARKPA